MARKFLYVIATVIVLVIAALLIYRVWGMQLIRAVMVPREPFSELKPLPANAYAEMKMWIARPDMKEGNPALWSPNGAVPLPRLPQRAAVFFIHPTSYITTFGDAHWNAPRPSCRRSRALAARRSSSRSSISRGCATNR